MKRLSFPVDIRDEALGAVAVALDVLLKRLGEPMAEVDDPDQYPGPVSLWAFEATDGMKVVVEFHKAKQWALIYAAPADIRRALSHIGLSPEAVMREHS